MGTITRPIIKTRTITNSSFLFIQSFVSLFFIMLVVIPLNHHFIDIMLFPVGTLLVVWLVFSKGKANILSFLTEGDKIFISPIYEILPKINFRVSPVL